MDWVSFDESVKQPSRRCRIITDLKNYKRSLERTIFSISLRLNWFDFSARGPDLKMTAYSNSSKQEVDEDRSFTQFQAAEPAESVRLLFNNYY